MCVSIRSVSAVKKSASQGRLSRGFLVCLSVPPPSSFTSFLPPSPPSPPSFLSYILSFFLSRLRTRNLAHSLALSSPFHSNLSRILVTITPRILSNLHTDVCTNTYLLLPLTIFFFLIFIYSINYTNTVYGQRFIHNSRQSGIIVSAACCVTFLFFYSFFSCQFPVRSDLSPPVSLSAHTSHIFNIISDIKFLSHAKTLDPTNFWRSPFAHGVPKRYA